MLLISVRVYSIRYVQYAYCSTQRARSQLRLPTIALVQSSKRSYGGIILKTIVKLFEQGGVNPFETGYDVTVF